MTAPTLGTTVLASERVDTSAGPGPGLAAVVRHLAANLIVATLIPTAMFYLCLVTAGSWVALVAALAWCYGTVAWRLRTGRPASGLLWLTVAGLTGKTVLVFATGSTLVYFAQPAIGDAVVAVLFLVSLTSARPAVARLAVEFYPLTREVASRPRVKLLFTRLSLLWAGICATKAALMLWLLHSLTMTSFVAVKSVLAPSVAVLGAAAAFALAVRVARREGLLPIGTARRVAVVVP